MKNKITLFVNTLHHKFNLGTTDVVVKEEVAPTPVPVLPKMPVAPGNVRWSCTYGTTGLNIVLVIPKMPVALGKILFQFYSRCQ